MLGEWVLVRKPELTSKGSPILLTPKTQAERKGLSRGIVVDVGPGEVDERGILRKPDPRIKPGVTVVTDGQYYIQPRDIEQMKEEGLYLVPASLIMYVEGPE